MRKTEKKKGKKMRKQTYEAIKPTKRDVSTTVLGYVEVFASDVAT